MITSKDPRTETIEDKAQFWLLRLTSGDVSAGELEEFKSWCAADPHHQAAYEEVRSLWNDIEGLKPSFGQNPKVEQVKPYRPYPVRIYGGLMAACVAFLMLYNLNIVSLIFADYSTGVGEQARITLPDGSRVTLNTDTALSVDYSEGQRTITLLQGEAFFEVEKDATRPFDVHARRGQTTAVGTAFVVRNVNEKVRITVTEGTVRITSPSGEEARGVFVDAGQRVSYRDNSAPGKAIPFHLTSALAWQRGKIALSNLALIDAFKEIDRYRPGKILVLASHKNLEAVTARLSLKNLDKDIENLASIHGLSVINVTDYLMIIH